MDVLDENLGGKHSYLASWFPCTWRQSVKFVPFLPLFQAKMSLSTFGLFFSVEIILRAEAVETAQAGDRCDFTGTLIVVPDVAQLSMPGKSGFP